MKLIKSKTKYKGCLNTVTSEIIKTDNTAVPNVIDMALKRLPERKAVSFCSVACIYDGRDQDVRRGFEERNERSEN